MILVGNAHGLNNAREGASAHCRCGPGLRFHDLRHTVITELAEKRAFLSAICQA